MHNYIYMLLFLTVQFALGCGGPRELVPAEGIVEFEGKPLADATVTFHNKEKDRYAVGQTDSKGAFRLATNAIEGAAPGEHAVIVTKMVLEEHMHIPPGQPKPETPDPKGRFRSVVPPKYSDFAKSGLSATVAASGSKDIKLILN